MLVPVRASPLQALATSGALILRVLRQLALVGPKKKERKKTDNPRLLINK